LNSLKAIRNKFAHHHVITEKEKKQLIKNADQLLNDITPTKPLSTTDLAALRKSSEQIARTLELLTKSIDMSAIHAFAKQQSEIATQLRAITLPSVEILNAFTRVNSVAFDGFSDAIKGLQGEWLYTRPDRLAADTPDDSSTEDDRVRSDDADDTTPPAVEKPKK
jgi:hypothetical protein